MRKKRTIKKLFWTILSLSLLFFVWYLGSQNEKFGRLMPNPIDVIKFIGESFVMPIGKKTLIERIRQITRLPKKVSPPDRGGES